MTGFVNARIWLAVLSATGMALMAGCAATPAASVGTSPGTNQVAANSCRPDTFAALMAAKLDPEQRPGRASLYKDCP